MTEHDDNELLLETEGRQKDVPIASASSVSRHIVDLTSFSRNAPAGPRPKLDLEQTLNVWVHALKFGNRAEVEHRANVPFAPHRKPKRASIGGFVRLPFAMLSLPFKARPARPPAPPIKRTALPAISAAAIPPTTPPAPVTIYLSRKKRGIPFAFGLFSASGWKRHVITFAVITLIVSLPLQALLSYAGLLRRANVIAAGAQEAVNGLKTAGEQALDDTSTSQASFARSAGAFADTRERVDSLTVRLAALLTGNGKKLSSGANLLSAGEEVSKAGAELTAGFDAMEVSRGTNAEKLKGMTQALERALPHLESGVTHLNDVSARSIPEAYRPAFTRIRTDAVAAIADLKRASSASGVLLDAIGAAGKRRYLIVFQNVNELRPTGGFIGSFALMDLEDGSIKKIDIPSGGSYDLRGGFNQRVAAPEQLRLVNPRWEFQDANWFADFPTSAQSLTWFYEKSGGPTVDGVIAVTSTLMERLLKQVGPVEMPEYGKLITSDNFALETQKAVEVEYDRETNRPKQIISDMAPKLLKKLVDGGSQNLPKLAGVLGAALASKDIQVYLRDEQAQRAASEFGWTGELRPAPQSDYLAVVDTNIAGGKTDGVIDETIRHETRVDQHGAIVNTVTVTRTHRGEPGALFTGIKNIDYLRLYVPKGSVLLSAKGFEKPGEGYFQPADDDLQPSTLLDAVQGAPTKDGTTGTDIHDESGLTVFGNWIQLEPGETRAVTISYRLPFRLEELTKRPERWSEKAKQLVGAYVPTAALKLIVRKQPGAERRVFSSHIDVPPGWKIRSSVPETAEATPDGLTLETPLTQDLYVGMVLTQRE